MQKAAEDLKKQQQKEAEEKQRFIEARVPKLDISGLGQGTYTYSLNGAYTSTRVCVHVCTYIGL